MRFTNALLAVGLIAGTATGQAPQPAAPPGSQPVRRGVGGLVPGQKRAAEDPLQIERGKILYGISCTSCHGADLRGGDLGGPNLLRSQIALSDNDGNLIIPIIRGSRREFGMPAIPMKPDDEKAVTAYIRSIVATIGRQGMPPSVGKEAPSILIGNAAAGQKYFTTKCASCHSATGDLQGIATRVSDPKTLQNIWLAGGMGGRRGPASGAPDARTPDVHITLPSNQNADGKLVRIDDYMVTIALADGSTQTFRRDGDVPKVELHDPMKAHKDLLAVYTDKDIHDVTAWLVTLK